MMSTLEELKTMWEQKENTGDPGILTEASLDKIIRRRVRKHTKNSFRYFWASFVLQVIVYSLLSHVIVKHGRNSTILSFAVAGVLLFIPFTIVLLRKFKKLVTEKPLQNTGTSLHDYVFRQQALLRSFYQFKKWYEFLLIPLSCAIGVTLVFELYVPGGVTHHWVGAAITLIVSLVSCISAIYAENKRSFRLPIRELQSILDEFEHNE